MIRRIGLSVIAAVLLSSCYTVRMDKGVAPGVREEFRQHFFLFGLINESNVYVPEICPNGVASFGEQFSPLDVLLSLITLGIYTPKTVVVECAA